MLRSIAGCVHSVLLRPRTSHARALHASIPLPALRASAARLAGHSKMAKIFKSKGANDVARGALFTKVSKMISSAAKAGGADPSSNLRLASALEAAKKHNVPRDIVDRALKSKEGLALEEFVFECKGPGGVSLLVTALTDNARRTTPAIKHILSKHGGSLAPSHVFAPKAVVTVAAAAGAPAQACEEAVMEAALGAGAEDVELLGGGEGALEARATAPREALAPLRAALLAAGLRVSSVLLARLPAALVAVEPGSDAEAELRELLDRLEAQEDVQSVTHNAELAEEEEGEAEGGA